MLVGALATGALLAGDVPGGAWQVARGRSRYRKRKQRLFLFGMVVAAGAGSVWFRSETGHFPWAHTTLGPAVPTSGRETVIPLIGEREAEVGNPDATPTGGQSADPASPGPSTEITADWTQAARDRNVTRPLPPATRPATWTPVAVNPAQAASEARAGMEALQKGDLVQARSLLAHAYQAGLPAEEARKVREALADLTGTTLFSPKRMKDDPLIEFVTVQPGDTLRKIADRYKLSEEFVADINGIKNRNIVRLGQKLKLVRGPFHATISKSEHLLHLYMADKYVRSFPVALGVDGSTPSGTWRVSNRQEDPGWTDPRTGQRWHPSDPSNPIGEFWIGMEGIRGDALGQNGYGIHGTIEPETVGKDASMGCVRMKAEDIALLYKLLLVGESYVVITD